MIEYDASLHNSIISGEKIAIGWGQSADLFLQLRKAPYQIGAIIDGTIAPETTQLLDNDTKVYGLAGLKHFHPENTVIIIFADNRLFGQQIADVASQYGFTKLTLPYNRWFHDPGHECISSLENLLLKPIPDLKNNKTCLLIHRLVRGGAERQICLLAIGLAKLGHEVTLISYHPTHTNCDDWELVLERHNVKREIIPSCRESTNDYKGNTFTDANDILAVLSGAAFHIYYQLTKILKRIRPTYCVSYLDDANVILGLAALEANVGHVVMSGRNVAPVNLPALNTLAIPKPCLKEVYRLLLTDMRVEFINNSEDGAASYEKWLGLSPGRIRVVSNASYEFSNKDVDLSELCGVNHKVPVVLGVMRQSEEKRPQLWLDVVQKLLSKRKVYALLIGDGVLQEQIQSLVIARKMQSSVKLVKFVDNIPSLMRQANLLLHTASEEGTPNVILEALHARLPIVSTVAGDIPRMIPTELHTSSLSYSAEASELANLADKALETKFRKAYESVVAKHSRSLTVEKLAALTLLNSLPDKT